MFPNKNMGNKYWEEVHVEMQKTIKEWTGKSAKERIAWVFEAKVSTQFMEIEARTGAIALFVQSHLVARQLLGQNLHLVEALDESQLMFSGSPAKGGQVAGGNIDVD